MVKVVKQKTLTTSSRSSTKKPIKKKPIKKKPLKKQPVRKINNQQPVTNDPNTMRNMLLMRSGLITPGFTPQQYGNVNDKISVLQATESNMKETNMRQKQQIDELNKSITELKKEKHDAEKKHYHAENEYDKLRIEVDEAERVKGKTDALKLKVKNLQTQLDEVRDDSNIKKLEEKRDNMQKLLDRELLANRILTSRINEDRMKTEIDKLTAERNMIVAQNKGMQDYVKSPEFMNREQTIIDKYTELQKEKAKKQYYDQLIELQQENVSLQLAKAATEAQQYSITKEEEKAIQDQILANTKLQGEIDELNSQKRKHDYYKQRLNKLSMQRDDLSDERDTIKAINDSLNKDLSNEINDAIKTNAEVASEKAQQQEKLDVVKQTRKSRIANQTSQAMFDYMSSPKYQQQENYIASQTMQKAKYDELTRQCNLMKAVKQQEMRSANAAYAAKKVAFEDIGALPEQIKDMEKAIDGIEQEETQAIDKYNEANRKKRELLQQLKDLQDQKIAINSSNTIENYLMEQNPWFGSIDDVDSHTEEEYRELLEGYSKWKVNETFVEEEEEGWSDNNNGNNNNNNNENEYVINATDNYGDGPDYSKDDFSYRRPSNKPFDPNWGDPP